MFNLSAKLNKKQKKQIAAIATPPGAGAVGIIRVSGPDARSVGMALFHSGRSGFAGFRPYHLHHGQLRTPEGTFVDEALVAFMPGPRSFTGEDVVELHCHGGMAILRTVMEQCLELGVRPAGPGEFSKRAFLNGRMDLARAEAVMELVNANLSVLLASGNCPMFCSNLSTMWVPFSTSAWADLPTSVHSASCCR